MTIAGTIIVLLYRLVHFYLNFPVFRFSPFKLKVLIEQYRFPTAEMHTYGSSSTSLCANWPCSQSAHPQLHRISDDLNFLIIYINNVFPPSFAPTFQIGFEFDSISQRGLVVRAKYFGISHARGHRFRTAVSKAWETFGRENCNV